MDLYHDVVVKGLDEDSSELVRPGNCDLVFALNEAPPPEWRDLFRRMAHERGNAALEHVRFNAGFVSVAVPRVNATGIVQVLVVVVRATNGAFREEHAGALYEQEAFAKAVAEIEAMLAGGVPK